MLGHPVPQTVAGAITRVRGATAPGPLARTLSWVVPTVVTGLVVWFRAAAAPPWRDEFASWDAAMRTAPQIVALGHTIDAVMLPYYLFLHVWVGWFGDSVTALRMPSMLAMTATAAATALLARRLYGNRAALLAGLLVATLPVVSRYGQEARGYALAALFATLATLALVAALARPRWWRWVAYAGCVLLLGWSHQVGLLLLAGHAVAVPVLTARGDPSGPRLGAAVAAARRTSVLWWAGAAAAGCAGVLPLALLGAPQRGSQLNWLSRATPDALAELPTTIFISSLVGGALCAIAVFALPRRGASAPADVWSRLLWLSVLLPYGLLFAADQLVAPMFVGRYLVFVVPLLCVLAGRALAGLRLHTALAVVLVLALVGLPAQNELRQRHSGLDYLAVADLLRNWSVPGDGVVYAPRQGWHFTDVAMRYYLHGAGPRDVLLQSDAVHNASLWPTECDDPAACLVGTPRVWVVSGDDLATGRRAGTTDQLSESVRDALRARYRQAERWRFDGFTVALFLARR
ncbi:glycosyltransferase family 39 protein [Krasilnikovia sp. MM14-A1259]|uniref:glycosyltransferase family 39 protein n=1 Tax=Krasilnikovia sp. MM14-A1259 TaxID=3373539 RepID=UPI003815321A